jgi:hypothetical protein
MTGVRARHHHTHVRHRGMDDGCCMMHTYQIETAHMHRESRHQNALHGFGRFEKRHSAFRFCASVTALAAAAAAAAAAQEAGWSINREHTAHQPAERRLDQPSPLRVMGAAIGHHIDAQVPAPQCHQSPYRHHLKTVGKSQSIQSSDHDNYYDAEVVRVEAAEELLSDVRG